MRSNKNTVGTSVIAVGLMSAVLVVAGCSSVPDASAPRPQASPGQADQALGLVDKERSFPAKVAINGRKDKGDAADAPGHKFDAYEKGESVPVKCQSSVGSEIWDYTADGWWVPDRYVTTGYDGFTPGVPRCDSGEDDSGERVHGRHDGPSGPTSGTRAEKIERVIAAATSQTGKNYSYAWGAGGKGGPSYGGVKGHIREGKDDYDRYGYDCSGFTQYAFWKGAGIDIGPSTVPQYTAGKKVSLKDLQRGDLIFWGDGDSASSTTHVAIYLGDGELIEASWPRNANSVRVKDVYGKESWTAHAIRVI